MPPPAHTLPALNDYERQYRELWPVVRGMLRRRFAGLDDHEELYQEAWTELLEYEAGGNEVRDTRALLKTIAERRASDRIRNYRPVVADPGSLTFTRTADSAPLPEEQVQVRLDAAAIRQVIETLDEREAAALKLRYDLLLDAKEISRHLGIKPKFLEKVMTSAYRQIADALEAGTDGESAWSKRQRSLLLACETGIASPRQRRQAQRMLDVDPHCRAALAQLRAALRDVAAVLPVPVVAAEPDKTRRVFEVVVDSMDRILPGGRRAGRQLVEGVAPSGASEPVAAGAAALGAGGVAKIALVCLAAGGTAALCVGVTEEPAHKPRRLQPAPVPRASALRPIIREPRAATLLPVKASNNATPVVKTRVKAPSSRRETPVSSPSAEPAPSPAPVGSTEFTPGALGSRSARAQPAVAPVNGGGEFTP